ncbi:MAG: SET domain-containing protein-lysine N-methyltransferase [Pirellula sp.]|jgi:hypothetical protein|nr:hypothetical protein [Pirellula sp.]
MYPESYGHNPHFPKASDFRVIKNDATLGFGVITYRAFKPGELIAALAGEVITQVTQHSLQIETGLHLLDLYFCGYFLHSCDPNVHLDLNNRTVHAIRCIRPGDYLLMDYAQTEEVLFKQFRCQCDSSNCRGWITGYKERPDEQSIDYQKYLMGCDIVE